MLQTVGLILFALAIPAALITSNVLALVYDSGFYLEGQRRFAFGKTTEFTLEQMRPIDNAIVAYFRSPAVSLPDALQAAGADGGVFSEREVHHMDDVRVLIEWVDRLQKLSLGIVVIYVIGGLILRGRDHVATTLGATALGAGLTLGLLALVGVLAATDFSGLFLRFHLVSFSNDLWVLDPARDNLIRIFPFEFWFDATLTVVLRTVVVAVFLLVAGLVGRRLVMSWVTASRII